MSQLLTQCPFCQTTFKVSDAQMQAANGVVRCGSCMEVFLAGQHRVILRERPAPVDANPFVGRPKETDTPQWQVVDPGSDDDGDAEEVEAAVVDEDSDHDLYSSWEEEERHGRFGQTLFSRGRDDPDDNVGIEWEEDAREPEEFPDDEQDFAETEDGEPGEDTPDAPADAPPEHPGYGGQLNPTGYLMSHFSADGELPSLTGKYSVPGAWQDNARDPGIEDDDPADDEAAEPGDDAMVGEQFPRMPASTQAPARTPVIVRGRSEGIPTLVPDMVAKEEIPAAGIGAQTMAWFQSFRNSLRDSRARKAEQETPDEKSVFRSYLSALRDEDSLDPVATEHLEVLDEAPVELEAVREQKLKNAGLLAASVLLVLALAGQYAWFNLDNLVRDRRLTTVTGVLCRLSECPDTQAIDLSTLVTEELVVRTHPSETEALQVDFIFRNDRNREQLFPLVELNFTDMAGDVVANRVFSSEQYLPPEMQLFTHMPAHSSIQVSLELVDPGTEATGYSLVFRNP